MKSLLTTSRHGLATFRLARTGLVAVMVALAATRAAQAQTINLTGSTYTQNFDNLFTTVPANNTTAPASTLPTGFSFVESGTNANTTLRVDNGSSGTGDTYLFGATGSNERALGSYASGSLTSVYGAVITNNTGTTLTSLKFSYVGEEWKDGNSTAAVPNALTFSYGVGNTSITTGTFTNSTALDFTAPINGSGANDVTLDGNLAANQVQFNNVTISGFSVAPGQTFVFRWSDINDPGNDDALGVDNISIAFVPVPEPGTVAVGLLALGTLGWSQRRRVRGFFNARRRRSLLLVAT